VRGANSNIGIVGTGTMFREFKAIAVGDALDLSAPCTVSPYSVDSIEVPNADKLSRRTNPITPETCSAFITRLSQS